MLSLGSAAALAAGGLLGFAAVVMAAVAAHALPDTMPPHAAAGVRAAIQMQAWHALALVFCALWIERAQGFARRLAGLAGTAFGLGALLFCGAVYAHDLAGVALGPVAPTGGMILMIGWLAIAASAVAARRRP